MRGNNHKLLKERNYYLLDLSEVSNEVWKDRWKQTIYERYRMIHPLKKVEAKTKYKGFMGLQPKVKTEQFDEAVNLVDTPA
jgi:hypothetical protein